MNIDNLFGWVDAVRPLWRVIGAIAGIVGLRLTFLDPDFFTVDFFDTLIVALKNVAGMGLMLWGSLVAIYNRVRGIDEGGKSPEPQVSAMSSLDYRRKLRKIVTPFGVRTVDGVIAA